MKSLPPCTLPVGAACAGPSPAQPGAALRHHEPPRPRMHRRIGRLAHSPRMHRRTERLARLGRTSPSLRPRERKVRGGCGSAPAASCVPVPRGLRPVPVRSCRLLASALVLTQAEAMPRLPSAVYQAPSRAGRGQVRPQSWAESPPSWCCPLYRLGKVG